LRFGRVKIKDRATTLSPLLFFLKIYIYKKRIPPKEKKNNHFGQTGWLAGWLAGKDLMKGSWPPRLAPGRHLMQICKVLGNAISPDLGK
jgi:hypothetical protein